MSSHFHSNTARIGDRITAYGQSYVVDGIDDFGQYVCRNLNERCLHHDEIRTFDDLDIDIVSRADDPAIFTAEGI